jgi:hypothetical protein
VATLHSQKCAPQANSKEWASGFGPGPFLERNNESVDEQRRMVEDQERFGRSLTIPTTDNQ